jgi:hypothetical protein
MTIEGAVSNNKFLLLLEQQFNHSVLSWFLHIKASSDEGNIWWYHFN